MADFITKKTSIGSKVLPSNANEKDPYFVSYKAPRSLIISPAFDRLNEPLGTVNSQDISTDTREGTQKAGLTNSTNDPADSTLQSRNKTSRSVRQGGWTSRRSLIKDSNNNVQRMRCQFMAMFSFVCLLSIGSILLTMLLIFGKVKGNCCAERIKGAAPETNKQTADESMDSKLNGMKKTITVLEQNLTTLNVLEQKLTTLNEEKIQETLKTQSLQQKYDKLEKEFHALKQQVELNQMALTNTSTKDCCLQATKDIINLKNKVKLNQMALTNTSSKNCCLQATKDIINLKNKLNITTFEMRSTDQTLHNTIMHINTSLTDQISNVSKQEGPSGPPGSQGPPGPQGPQGPPGIQGPVASGGANLSLCQFKIATSTPVTANSLAETDLIWMEPSGKRIVGATCSTNAALEYNFNSYTKPSGERVYRCMCKGQSSKFSSSTGQMYCYLNYWECPLN